MRLGVVYEPNSSNSFYRAIEPMRAMERRGHEVIWPDLDGAADLRRLAVCDVVHVYRRAAEDTWRAAVQLTRGGIPIIFDNDDDFTTVPKESPAYRTVGGLAGQRIFLATVKMARLAHTFTTTNDVLADRYRRAGVERVEVVANYVSPNSLRRRRRHRGLVIGWVAGMEHQADTARVDIAGVLRRVLAKHRSVRVECIGVNLKLEERYRHDGFVPFQELPGRIAGFNVGLAPLADIPVNWARSDIKLKEYAASGVPWLASPVGPYVGLGKAQGGWLVPDHGWYEALDRLLTHRFQRAWLALNAKAWAMTQTIDSVADRWEQLFTHAAGTAVGNGQQTV